MKALIFGISGQDGFYLRSLLEKANVNVYGVSRSAGNWILGNVSNKGFVEGLIKEARPEFIFHFAANSTTRHDALFENHESIDAGTLNILETCYKYNKKCRVFLSGSAVQFENTGQPIDESTPFAALSAYAVSRIQSVYAGRYYRSLGLKVYVGYFFNHDSPLRTERHINQKIIAAVKRIAKGSNEILEVGNVSTKKEFNFAGDSVAAIWKLVDQENVFEAVIGCGKAYAIKDWIEMCFKLAGLNSESYVQEKTGFKAEYDTLVSDPSLIYSLGWKPEVSIDALADMMYRHS